MEAFLLQRHFSKQLIRENEKYCVQKGTPDIKKLNSEIHHATRFNA